GIAQRDLHDEAIAGVSSAGLRRHLTRRGLAAVPLVVARRGDAAVERDLLLARLACRRRRRLEHVVADLAVVIGTIQTIGGAASADGHTTVRPSAVLGAAGGIGAFTAGEGAAGRGQDYPNAGRNHRAMLRRREQRVKLSERSLGADRARFPAASFFPIASVLQPPAALPPQPLP